MTRLLVSPIAERDMEDIWLTIAIDNESAATKLLCSIGAKIQQLQRFPRIGQQRSDIRPATRMLVEGFYLVLYEVQPDTDEGAVDLVEIVRVVDGRRDLARLLTERR